MRRFLLFASLVLVPSTSAFAQRGRATFTHADTLRGTYSPQRAWWNVTYYDLHVSISPSDSSIRGYNGITYHVVSQPLEMQIDLQVPLEVDSMMQDGKAQVYRRDGNAFFVTLSAAQKVGANKTITVYYHGKPRVAHNAPWDGGLVWSTDSLGNQWIATACEGLGASVWWPNKDSGYQEPDSQRIAITVPSSIMDVSNGRLRKTTPHDDGTTTYDWFVANPINNYDVEANAGVYAHFSDVYAGEAGKLTLDFWPLAYHLDTAKVQFQQVKLMLACFEHWFGPYPWYQDGYKLIEAPHLGMEHQSGVAYGNHYVNGYWVRGRGAGPGRGTDLSGTGLGLKWDYIIVHESAHEWFGNSITAKDDADEWIHESFADYSEALYTECQQGKEAGARYAIGLRRTISNTSPIIGTYGVNKDGSQDMYNKGTNILHTIRQVVDNDEKWRGVLRGLSKTFYHQTVTTKQIEDYMSKQSGVDLSAVFNEYLRTTMIPVLEYKLDGSTLSYRWANVVPGFKMPVKVTLADSSYSFVHPTEEWKTATVKIKGPADFHVDQNFYVTAKNVGTAVPASSGSLPAKRR